MADRHHSARAHTISVQASRRRFRMKMRAAVLEEFGEPLVVQEVELAEPRAGRGAGPAGRLRRLPHRPLHGLRRRPLRLRADRARPRGRRRGRGGRRRASTSLAAATTWSRCSRRSAASASTAATSAPTSAWRSASSRTRATCPTGPRASRRDGEQIRHFMGTSTFAEYTVMPEIALAKVNPEAPLDRACLFACGLSTGLGAAINTAKVEPGSTCVVFGAGHGRPRRGRRLPAAGRRADHLRRPLRRPARAGDAARARPRR